MSHELYLLVAVVVLGIAYTIPKLVRILVFRGNMLVTCPENRLPAAVRISMWRAALAEALGGRRIQLRACSRWPEHSGCAQDCVCQVLRDPEGHRVWNIAGNWFKGKSCAFCGKPITRLGRLERPPALLDADKKTTEWRALPPEKLPEAFWGSKAVCWSCHVAETFMREHGDLVTYRPWERSGPMGEYTPHTTESEKEEPRRAA